MTWCQSMRRARRATQSCAISRKPARRVAWSFRWQRSRCSFILIFRDGAFTANDPEVRAYALQKTMRAMDLGAELGAKIFVLWGGREGVETDACRRPDEAVKRLRKKILDRKSTRLNSSHGYISYAVFCLKKKKKT